MFVAYFNISNAGHLSLNILVNFHFFFKLRFPKGSLPPAPFTLTAEEKVIADKRLALVKVPMNFGVVPATLFTRICGGVKSHTWLQVKITLVFFFLYEDHSTKINNQNINTGKEKRPQHFRIESKCNSWLETDANICQWLMRKMCYEALLS